VLGALKVLTREETWVQVGEGVEDACNDARSLIARATEPCAEIPPETINWVLEEQPLSGQVNFWSLIEGGPGVATYAIYEGFLELPDVFGSVDFVVKGKNAADLSLQVGGHVTSVLIEPDGGANGVVTFFGSDCSDNTDIVTEITPVNVADKQYAEMRIMGLINLHVTVRIDGLWECGPV
jgi:hypothetical protein